jgi:quinol-cytochrome oxidoreductase complex cytochrome b subunit
MESAMRALAVSTALLHLVLCGIAGFFMFFFATFPFENPSPETEAADDWLVGGAAVIVIVALTLLGGVIARRVALSEVVLVAQLIVGAVILSWAVGQTNKSDGVLVLCALAVAIPAVVATAATGAARRSDRTPSTQTEADG